MLYALMINEDGRENETLSGIFTHPDPLMRYITSHPVDTPLAYSVTEYQENLPGIARRTDIALISLEEPPGMITENPIVADFPMGGLDIDTRRPLDIAFQNLEGNILLRIFETSDGILDAQFRPADLTEGATIAVREFMKIYGRA